SEDPFPIRRVRVAEAQLPELLKTLEPDTLVRLPRAEFESRVRKAAAAASAAKVVPRVVEATYTAALSGDDLTGTAERVTLTLPAGHTPAAAAGDAMLTGPFPVPGDERRRWQVRFGGRSKLDLTVRGPGLPGGTGLVQATLAARYDLAPGQTTCTFEYDMQL